MKTWLITGCSSGLGKSLAQKVLEHGDQAVVTARNPDTVQHFRESFPETAYPLQLDVHKDDEAAGCIAGAIEHFGKIDVLVNNAGYCLRGAVEECSFEEIRKQFETNFFGTLRMIQHVLPHMRRQKSGVIINFSSIAALRTAEGSAFYGASKCAVEGLSDGLRKEVGPLGIQVIVVEPGPFRTDFFGRSIAVNENNIGDYKNTAGKRKVRLANPEDSGMKGWGDNSRAAEVIITAADNAAHGKEFPFRLLLGSCAVRLAEEVYAARAAETAKWKELSIQTDAD
ncbi:MAG: oxidoreductase [Desulfovibrionaceae bacterium]|nr:oxidoreductase [Desulfovibrionaceae bacterium]